MADLVSAFGDARNLGVIVAPGFLQREAFVVWQDESAEGCALGFGDSD
jgi:hypothetical protein